MKIDQTDAKFSSAVIFLNGRPCLTAVEADEEAGYVLIPDLQALPPLDLEASLNLDEPELTDDCEGWEEVPLKKKFGKVTIKFSK